MIPRLVEIKLLHPRAKLPTKAHASDAGWDIYSIGSYDIAPGTTVNVETGIAAAAPEGFYFTIDGRSGLSRKGIFPFRGILDAGYQGPICAALTNVSSEPYRVNDGDRVAQLILHRCEALAFNVVQDFRAPSARGTKGFGSSGR